MEIFTGDEINQQGGIKFSTLCQPKFSDDNSHKQCDEEDVFIIRTPVFRGFSYSDRYLITVTLNLIL
jgi:hypothetical protein